jgi:hypothetical protein
MNDMAKFRGTEYSKHCSGSTQTCGGMTVSPPTLVQSNAKVQHLAPFYLKDQDPASLFVSGLVVSPSWREQL